MQFADFTASRKVTTAADVAERLGIDFEDVAETPEATCYLWNAEVYGTVEPDGTIHLPNGNDCDVADTIEEADRMAAAIYRSITGETVEA